MKLHDTMTGGLMQLDPVVPGKISIYVCGVTPYDSAHVGHAMSLIVYDVLVRYLRWRGNPAGGYEVTFVSNYTDVDDKLIDRGAALGLDPLELANRNIAQWEDEQERLGLLRPDVRPRVSLEIDNIKRMTEEIVANGFGYVTPSGDVYFRVRAKADYGKLSHRKIDELLTGTRFEPGEEKEDPLDFALWKAAKPGEPSWPSPCGIEGSGRPGWHIECSAMSRRTLGERFDIHGGGLDLIFPHHENEIAQAEAAANADRPVFARLWMHNGMVQRDGEKMSKSIGNVVSVADALERWSPDAIRLYVLNTRYRAATNLTDEAMAAATAGVERLRNALARDPGGEAIAGTTAQAQGAFIEAMEDDLATPRAVGVLFDLARDINRVADTGQSVRAMQDLLRELAGVLGLALEERDAGAVTLTPEQYAGLADLVVLYYSGSDSNTSVDPAVQAHERVKMLIMEFKANPNSVHTRLQLDDFGDLWLSRLINDRVAARATKNFTRADEIRSDLDEIGIVIEDTPQGARWSVRR